MCQYANKNNKTMKIKQLTHLMYWHIDILPYWHIKKLAH